VPTPVLVLRQPVIEGESVEHIVIRSRVGTPGLPGNLFFATNDRHVAPASASLDTAITHGMLDPFFNDPNRSFNIGLKSDGSFLDQTIIDIRNGHSNPAPGVQIVNGPEVPPGSPTFPAHPGDGLLPGQYVIHTENKLELPYLPDPIAAGVALGDVPPNPADLTVPGASPNPPVGLQKMFFEGTWPLLEPNKIVVTATNGGAPTLDMKGDDFVVGLPPATILRLRLSSLIRQADLQNMAIWNLLSAADQTRLLQGALDGQHWLISPWREIVATHAVNKPLAAATFTALTVSPDRQLGETFAVFQGTIQNHSHSTGQLDMQASWSDRVDRLTDPAPTDEPHSGKVKSFRPAYDDSSFTIPTTAGFLGDPRPRHDFGDTKHRYVDYRADATTRYLENFPAGTADNPSDVMVTGLSTRINILSTARPDKPQILYIVPTFRWEVQDHGKTSTRVGRGLRVYLARPWFSTGIDELLGVLIPQNPAIDAADDAAEGFISEWGSDPVWDTGGPTTNLVATDFLNSLPPPADPLSIKEKPTSVRVVPFPVTFDTDRQVWFADIEMRDTGSYFPFVRLALSRYQPFSITDAALSPVVRADFVQLVNDRSATAFTQPGSVHVSVTGVAGHNRLGADIVAAMLMSMTPAPSAPPGFVFDASAGAGRLVTAHIEQRRRQDGDLDWLLVSDVVVLASFSPSGGAGPGVPVLWDGSVPSPPRGHANGDQEFRLVIREIEIFDTDPDTAESVTIALPMGRSAVRGRVAYLDVLPLDDPDKW
jgi:hypothetical protein